MFLNLVWCKVCLPAYVCKIAPVYSYLWLELVQFLSGTISVVAVGMAVWILGTVLLDFYHCLCQKLLVSYHNTDAAF